MFRLSTFFVGALTGMRGIRNKNQTDSAPASQNEGPAYSRRAMKNCNARQYLPVARCPLRTVQRALKPPHLAANLMLLLFESEFAERTQVQGRVARLETRFLHGCAIACRSAHRFRTKTCVLSWIHGASIQIDGIEQCI